MKTTLKLYSFLLLITTLVWCQRAVAGEDPLVKKTKTYSKSYPVSSSDKVSFQNKFGELKINTWNKNEVKVDVTITAEANTDEKAQQILDGISVADGKSGNGVFFTTKVGNSKTGNKNDKNWEKGEKQGFTIDYVVYMPSGNPLHAQNEFGATTIGDYNGDATMVSKFGSLTTGKLTNAKKVTVEFGQATIESINNGDLSVKFGKATIKGLGGNMKTSFEFCDGVLINVNNNISALTIKNSYSNLYLDLNTGLSASFDISTHFGELNNKSNFTVKEDKEDDNKKYGPRFNHQYTGKAGSGNATVKIRSEFGEVTLGHNLPENVINEKKKNKKKVSI